MVSLWPWKGEDNSPASFEKTLSALATKISNSQQQLDFLRQRGRRVKALWTLYTSFTYLLCFILFVLVVGWKNWGAVEYTAIAGSPTVIYLIRTGISSYYDYRVDTVQARLEERQVERAKTIEKLKAATKYDSTQELLEKYGGAPPKKATPKPKKEGTPSKGPPQVQRQPSRTNMGPPATANIPRINDSASQPSTPQPIQRGPPQMMENSPNIPQPQGLLQPGSPEFAPNAFSAPQQYAYGADANVESHWYDRVLDLLMGDDETSPKNRIVLICQNCKLVNGQAPPGTKRLEDLGRWRCFGCGGWNGEEDEGLQAVKEIQKRIEIEQSEPVTAEKGADTNKRASEDEPDAGDDEPVLVGSDADASDESATPKKGRPKSSRKKA